MIPYYISLIGYGYYSCPKGNKPCFLLVGVNRKKYKEIPVTKKQLDGLIMYFDKNIKKETL